MRRAETVTFAGGNLDRAAHLRPRAAEVASQVPARAIPFWRGKPLMTDAGLARLPMDHTLMADAHPDMILLGCDGDAPLFAADLSGWTPPEGEDGGPGGFLDTSLQRHPAVPGAAFTELRAVLTLLSRLDAELASTAKAVLHWHRSHRFCAACGAESRIAMGGWQRDCAACGAHHFPRTDPVVIMLITRGNSVLLGRSPGWPDGMYSCLAGFVEPGETIEAAVRREVFEESGVRVGAVRYLSSQPWAFPASLMLGCHGEALDNTITIDPSEIEDARWVTREDLALAMAGHYPQILPARKGAIAHFLLHHWLADRLE